ncbi:MAG: type II toxin-antitoxin system VapC family toxin, partial [Caulobacteraceae bacterium]
AESARAVLSMGKILEEIVPSYGLAQEAFNLAAEHGFSAYDGTYIALAQARRYRLLTADLRLVRRARRVGLRELLVSLLPAD